MFQMSKKGHVVNFSNVFMGLIEKIFSLFSKEYEVDVKALRDLLYKFDKDSVILVEDHVELVYRANDYIKRFRGDPNLRLDSPLLNPIEKITKKIEKSGLFKSKKLFKGAR